MSLIENIQRENLNPMEEAAGIQRLVDEFKMTHEQAADAVGRSRSATTNLLRLLKLRAAGAGNADGRRARHGPRARAARARRRAPDRGSRNRVAAKGLSVRETEALVQQQLRGASAAAAQAGRPRPRAARGGAVRSGSAPRSRSAPRKKGSGKLLRALLEPRSPRRAAEEAALSAMLHALYFCAHLPGCDEIERHAPRPAQADPHRSHVAGRGHGMIAWLRGRVARQERTARYRRSPAAASASSRAWRPRWWLR